MSGRNEIIISAPKRFHLQCTYQMFPVRFYMVLLTVRPMLAFDRQGEPWKSS